jgi:Spy/CpxP family protein refolding chaperone
MKACLLAVALLWAGAALAQAPDAPPGGGPGMRHENPAARMDRLATLLDLTDAQKTQVAAVLEQEHTKAQAAREQAQASGTRPTPEQMKATHEQMEQETLAKLTPILSPTQLQKFQALMAERRGPGGPGGPHGGPPPQSSN